MERWSGRTAIVTGAGSGIGEAVARLLAQNGMKVVAVDQDLSRLKVSDWNERTGEVHEMQGDVTKEEDVLRIVNWTTTNLGGADVLVNSAGVYRPCTLSSAKTQDMRCMLDVNVFGLCCFTREVVKNMRERAVDDGHIVHINSLTGHRMSNREGYYFYAATKHAVRVMTEGLRRELRDLNTKIRVTSVSPGQVRTGLLQAAGLPEEFIKKSFENPFLEPSDVAQAVQYALSAPPHVQVHEIIMHPLG